MAAGRKKNMAENSALAWRRGMKEHQKTTSRVIGYVAARMMHQRRIKTRHAAAAAIARRRAAAARVRM